MNVDEKTDATGDTFFEDWKVALLMLDAEKVEELNEDLEAFEE